MKIPNLILLILALCFGTSCTTFVESFNEEIFTHKTAVENFRFISGKEKILVHSEIQFRVKKGIPRIYNVNWKIAPGEYTFSGESNTGYFYAGKKRCIEFSHLGLPQKTRGGIYISKDNPSEKWTYYYPTTNIDCNQVNSKHPVLGARIPK